MKKTDTLNFDKKNINNTYSLKTLKIRPLLIRILAIFMVFFISISVKALFLVDTDITTPEAGVIDLTNNLNIDDTLFNINSGWIYTDIHNKSSITSPAEIIKKESDIAKTCRIKIKVNPKQKSYGIVMPNIDCPYSLSINKKIYYNNGMGKNGSISNDNRKINHLNIICFSSNASEITIALTIGAHKEINNFIGDIYFGDHKIADTQYMYILSTDILLFSVMFLLFCFFSLLSIYDKHQKNYISFAILCFLCMVRIIFMNNSIIGSFFPNISYIVSELIQEISVPLTSLFILIFSIQLYPNYISKTLYNSLIILHIVVTAANLILLNHPINYMADIFTIVSSFTLCVIIYVSLKACVDNRSGALNFYFSILILLLSSLQNKLPSLQNNNSNYMVSISYIIFAVLQIIGFLDYSTGTLEKETYLSKTYDETINNLRKEETNFLSSHLKPHFLFNALNIISGYALFDPANSKTVISSLKIYLKQLFEHDNLNEMNTLENEIALLKAFGHIEYERFPEIEFKYDIRCDRLDIPVPALILQPLLENAVNHGIRKQSEITGTISISVIDNEKYVSISISDDGTGMDSETIKKALSKPLDNKFHSLYHLDLRLKELYNEHINIKSTPGKGTVISFNIPYSLPSQQ